MGLFIGVSTWYMTAWGCWPEKGTSLVSSCHSSTPRLYTSHAGLAAHPRRNSGAWSGHVGG